MACFRLLHDDDDDDEVTDREVHVTHDNLNAVGDLIQSQENRPQTYRSCSSWNLGRVKLLSKKV